MQRTLDSIDRNIISSIQKNPDLTQSSIAKKLGISQSAVATRWKRLKEHGPVTVASGLDVRKLGLETARIDVQSKDPKAVLDWAKRCVLVLNGSIGVGDGALSLFVVAEESDTFQYIVNNHLRVIRGVKNCEFLPVLSWINQFPAMLSLDVAKSPAPPCGMLPYCPGCPANPKYNGRLWDGASNSRDNTSSQVYRKKVSMRRKRLNYRSAFR